MGTSHCGSTLLSFLLNTHPDIVSIGEASPSLKRNKDRNQLPCSCGELLGKCPFWTAVYERVSKQGYPFTALNWAMSHVTDRRKRDLFYRNRPNYFLEMVRKVLLLTQYKEIKRKNRANEVAIRTILELSGKKVFGDASKVTFRVELMSRYPVFDIRLIWLVRDVRAFANSMKRKKLQVEEAAESWYNGMIIMERIFKKFPENKRLLLRYEDLCIEPSKYMNQIFSIAEVEPFNLPENFKQTEHHIIGNRMRLSDVGTIRLDEKWKENLTRQEQHQALKIGGRYAQMFGYQ